MAQPTNGPYHWGNGPKPKKSVLANILKALAGKKGKGK